jgi:PAS domain S-box-containing protein
MPAFRNLKVKWKIILPYIFVVSFTGGSMMIWYVYSETKRLHAEQTQKMEIVIKGLAEASAHPLAIREYDRLRDLLMNLKAIDPDIQYVDLVNNQNRSLAGKHEVSLGDTQPTEPPAVAKDLPSGLTRVDVAQGGADYELRYPVKLFETVMGQLRVGVSEKRIHDTQKTIFLVNLAVGIVAIISGILIFRWIIRGQVLGPIQELGRVSHEVSVGRLGARAEYSSEDELGTLARAFNSMTDQLKQTLEGLELQISEREVAEAELRGSEERYRSLVNNIDIGVTLLDLDYNIVMTNAARSSMTDGVSHDLRGKKCYQELRKLETVCPDCPVSHAAASGLPVEVACNTARNDGTLMNLRFRAIPVFRQTGSVTGYIEIAEDVTARTLLEEQLRQAAKMEAIGRLAGGIAHDFNNLLTVMTGYSSMLHGQFPEGSSQAEKLVQIQRAAERATSLTRQLLAFSRRQVLEMRVLDLHEVLQDVEKMLRRIVGEDVELITVPRAFPSMVKADQDQIAQLLMNLAVNARDAMPEGGRLTIETDNVVLDPGHADTPAEVQPGSYVALTVSDTGIGMHPQTVARVFEPFFTTKPKGVGTGLGLATVFGIVKQHGGHLTVDSEPGHGSTFRVYFPETEPVLEKASRPLTPSMALSGGETVLVVEDEEFVRDYACEVLNSLGYIVIAARDPKEAVLLTESHSGIIHLLLTDVVLPLMDGKSLFEELHQKRAEMRVLYMSGYADDAIVHHGVLETGVHFLQKPFSVSRLAKKVAEALGRRDLIVAEDSWSQTATFHEMDEKLIFKGHDELPEELLDQLSRAAIEGNMARMADAVDKIRELDEALANVLGSWLERFHVEKILRFVERQGRS